MLNPKGIPVIIIMLSYKCFCQKKKLSHSKQRGSRGHIVQCSNIMKVKDKDEQRRRSLSRRHITAFQKPNS